MSKHFSTVITVCNHAAAFEREGCIFFVNKVNVSFNVMLSTLSLSELGELLDHQEKTTSLIIKQYRNKLNEKNYDSNSG